MILPIYGYGHKVLRKKAEAITKDYPDLDKLIANMYETMYEATGVGLAAPQIGKSIRIFVIDTEQTMEDDDVGTGINQVFINPQKIEEGGKLWLYDEGCLSIPEVRGDVERPAQIRLTWYDENFDKHDEVFLGINARVIQHEYDHLEGILFTDLLKPLRRRLVKRKLEKIRTGKIEAEYRMLFAGK
ncbi:MAG: peptide deformylase [Bacteroidota bacterium]